MFRFLSAFIVVAASSGSHAVAQHNTLTADERAAGWQLLFDGQTLSAWRGFKQADMPAGWSVRDGTILRTGPGGDILTRETLDKLTAARRASAGELNLRYFLGLLFVVSMLAYPMMIARMVYVPIGTLRISNAPFWSAVPDSWVPTS